MNGTGTVIEAVKTTPLGPLAKTFTVHTSESGQVVYHCDERGACQFCLSKELGRRTLGALAIPGAVVFFSPDDHHLVALGYVHHRGNQAYLIGPRFGTIVSAKGNSRVSSDPLGEMLELQLPFQVDHLPPTIRVTFEVSYPCRDQLVEHWRDYITFSPDSYHIDLAYDPESGQAMRARVLQVDRRSHEVLNAVPVEGFPLIWDEVPTPTRNSKAKTGAIPVSELTSEEPSAPPKAAAVAPAARKAPPPVKATAGMPAKEMIQAIQDEEDPDRRWRMIMDNLALERADRTYQLLMRFGEEISARTANWDVKRIWEFFHLQAGLSLVSLVSQYTVDKVLDVARVTSEPDHVLDWLHERELERLLDISHPTSPRTREEAIDLLNIRPEAKPDIVRRVWQQELAWLSAEQGHHPGSPILKRRDAVAQALHDARDILLEGS